MSLKINDTNYSHFKRIYEIIWKHYGKLLPAQIIENANPVDILNQWEKKSKTIAKRGLKEGLRDMITMLKEFPPDILKDIDADLAKNNLPTTAMLYGIVRDTIGKVLKQQKIKTLDEFYIVKELVLDLTSQLDENERKLLDRYMTEFEFASTKNNGR